MVVSVGILLAMTLSIRDYLTDETFIHLQYARHLAGGHGLVFNLGERVTVAPARCGWPCSPTRIALRLDGVVLARRSWAWWRRSRRSDGSCSSCVAPSRLRRLRAAATVGWAGHAWMARWAMSGMETPLAVALVLAGFVAFTEGRTWGARPVRTGSLWALAALTRPEVMLLLSSGACSC